MDKRLLKVIDGAADEEESEGAGVEGFEERRPRPLWTLASTFLL